MNNCRCGGVTIQNVVFKNLPLMEHDPANIKMVIPLGLGEGDINTKVRYFIALAGVQFYYNIGYGYYNSRGG